MSTYKNLDIVVCIDGNIIASMPITPYPTRRRNFPGEVTHKMYHDDLKKVAHALADALFNEAKRKGGWTLANKMYGTPTYALDLAAHHIVSTFANTVYELRDEYDDDSSELVKRGWRAAHELANGLGKASESLVTMFENLGVLQLR